MYKGRFIEDNTVLKRLAPVARKYEAYLVGGYLRDVFLKRESPDFDFVVFGKQSDFINSVASGLGVSFFRFGNNKTVWRSYGAPFTIDISEPKDGDIKSDLLRRDLTINAMAYDFRTGSIIDPVDARTDLKNGIIRIIDKNAIVDDPLRMLRAFRIASELKFKISAETLELISRHKRLIKKVSSERIGEEFLKLMNQESYRYIVLMNKTGMLDQLFGKFRYANECTQNRFHLYDVKDHSLLTVRKIDEMLKNRAIFLSDNDELMSFITKNRVILKLAALFHDIGKPFVKTDYQGFIHFYRHEAKGARIFENEIAPRLSLAKNQTIEIKKIILYHLAPTDYFRLFREQNLQKKHKIRFFVKFDKLGLLILFLSIADTLAKGQIPRALFVDMLQMFLEFADFYYADYLPKISIPPFITGDDIIERFNLKPSPYFRVILDKIRKKQLSGFLKDKNDAIKYASEIITKDTDIQKENG